jgi:hypothetical protein
MSHTIAGIEVYKKTWPSCGRRRCVEADFQFDRQKIGASPRPSARPARLAETRGRSRSSMVDRIWGDHAQPRASCTAERF